jgi:hypothetical protein
MVESGGTLQAPRVIVFDRRKIGLKVDHLIDIIRDNDVLLEASSTNYIKSKTFSFEVEDTVFFAWKRGETGEKFVQKLFPVNNYPPLSSRQELPKKFVFSAPKIRENRENKAEEKRE